MKKIILICFLLTVFFVSYLPVKDTDFGWHYRCGNEALTQGKLCTSNTFSYFLPDYKAYYPSFTYDIMLAALYNTFGFTGVALVGGMIMSLAGYLFLKIIHSPDWMKMTSFLTVIALSQTVFAQGLRPQLITFMFCILTLFLIEKIAAGKQKYFYFFPPLFLLWVNTHIGFFTGATILGFFCIGQLWERKHIKEIIITGTLSLMATLMNPFGFNVYVELMKHSTAKLDTMIAEWVPPDMFHIVLISLCGLFLLVLIFREKPFSIYKILLTIFFGLLAFTARRNLPLFYTVFFYILLNSQQVKKIVARFSHLKTWQDVLLPFAITFALLAAFIRIPETTSFNTSWQNYCDKNIVAYPCEALDKYPQLAGNVFAMYESGGFLIWQKPEIKVFSDGRMPAWYDEDGESPYAVFLRILQTQPGWNEQLKKLKTDYIMIPPATFMGVELQQNSKKHGWTEVYRDERVVIYKNAASTM